VIFSDLDGTLLSAENYRPGPSLEALGICRNAGFPVVFVSSKTRAEIERLRDDLDNDAPFISENGGGIYLPVEHWAKPHGFQEDKRYWRLVLGKRHETLCTVLAQAAERCKAEVEALSGMSLQRLMEITGLTAEEARLARQREFDEPFLIKPDDSPAISCLVREIEKSGLSMARGGRFFHIMGECDKGKAVRLVIDLYRAAHPDIRAAAIGDAENDLPMLKAVDYPYLVRQPDGLFAKGLAFEGLTITEGIGPRGFREAIGKLTTKS
jgi:mannosyl-3-phosphoglycerate phosphatase